MIKTTEANTLRIGKAILKGWGLLGFKKALSATSRHSVWVQKPEDKVSWYVEKTDGAIKDWVKSLLDKAGVPI